MFIPDPKTTGIVSNRVRKTADGLSKVTRNVRGIIIVNFTTLKWALFYNTYYLVLISRIDVMIL